MGLLRAATLAVLAFALAGISAMAQDITLTSRDGSVEVVGTLLGYDGEFYRINSIYGELTVDGSGVLCSGPGCPDLQSFVAEISLSGAPTLGEVLVPAMLLAFAQSNNYQLTKSEISPAHNAFELLDQTTGQTAARFHVYRTSSDEGFADLLAEETDIALSLREVSEAENQLGEDAGLGRFSSTAQNRVVALDALVPVVSPRNTVQEITLEDLAKVFSGDIRNWSEIGGIDAAIARHLWDEESAGTKIFDKRIMAPAGREISSDTIYHASGSELVAAVAADPFAIGLSTLATPGDARALELTGGCGFRASAVPEALKSNDYPMTAPLFFYLKARRLPAIGREFLRFSRSPAAQIAILQAGFVDQGVSRTPISRQGDRFANAIRAAGDEITLADLKQLVSALERARRLSITFRFDGGSSRLTAHSQSNVALLARALETGTIGAREVVFVGFSDGEGSADVNKRLSRQRARSVRQAVIDEATTADLSRVSLQVLGFGEAMPMACDDTEWGREINRRVEVWVR